jgi:hypothetical protein
MVNIGSVTIAISLRRNTPRRAHGLLYPESAKIRAAVRRHPSAACHSAGPTSPARSDAGSTATIEPPGQGDVFNPDNPLRLGQGGIFNPDTVVRLGQRGSFNPDRPFLLRQTSSFNPDRPSLPGKSETFGHTMFALVKENQHLSQNRLQNVKKCSLNRFPSLIPHSKLATAK